MVQAAYSNIAVLLSTLRTFLAQSSDVRGGKLSLAEDSPGRTALDELGAMFAELRDALAHPADEFAAVTQFPYRCMGGSSIAAGLASAVQEVTEVRAPAGDRERRSNALATCAIACSTQSQVDRARC